MATEAELEERLNRVLSAPPRESVAGDVARGAGQGAFRGAAALLGLPAEVVNALGRYGAAVPFMPYMPQIPRPQTLSGLITGERGDLTMRIPFESGDIQRGVLGVLPGSVGSELTGQVGTPGRYTRAMAEWSIPAILGGPGGVLNRAVTGGISGLASEGAGDAARALNAPAWAQTAASLAAGLGAYGVLNRPQLNRANPSQVVREATADIRPGEWREGMARAAAADAAGVRLPPAQSLGPAGASVAGLTSDVAASRQGAPILRALREQVTQADDAARAMANNLGGPRVEAPQLARDTSQAARGVIQEARRFRTAQAQPFYEAAAGEAIPANSIRATINQRLASVDPGGPEAARLRHYAERIEGAQNVAQLDNIYKSLRSEIDGLFRANPSDATAAVLTDIRDPLNRVLMQISPNIRTGRTRYQIASERVDELRRPELLGNMQGELREGRRIAPELNRQIEALTGDSASPVSISRIFSELGMSRNPDAARNLAGEYLYRSINNAATARGANPEASSFGGYLRNALVGDPDQAARTQAVIRGLAQANGLNPNTTWAGFSRFMDVLNQMGRIPAIGSRTGPRESLARSMGDNWGSRALDALNVTQGSMLRTGSGRLREMAASRDYADLARVLAGSNPKNVTQALTNVEALRMLQEMAGQFAGSPRARLLAVRLLESGREVNTSPGGTP